MSVVVNNTASDLNGATLLKAAGDQTVTGNKTFDRGTNAPFSVAAGAGKVDNLDVDKLDGQDGAYYTNADNLTSGKLPTARLATEQVYTSTGVQNDVAPDAGAVVEIQCTGAAPVLSGFSGGVAGRALILVCKGTTLKITHEDAASAAANRIICEATSGQIVGVNGAMLLIYDAANARWMATLLATGAPITFTPTWTASGVAPALGNGTLTGRYVQRGKIVWCEFNFIAGGTSTFGTGTYAWALPMTAADADKVRLTGEVLDSSAVAFWIAWTRPGGTTATVLVAATGATIGTVGQTFPAAWATGDTLRLGGQYEVP